MKLKESKPRKPRSVRVDLKVMTDLGKTYLCPQCLRDLPEPNYFCSICNLTLEFWVNKV